MNKRLVLKTVIICLGIFIMIASLAVFYINYYYEFDTEEKYQVLVATTEISPSDVINESMVAFKTIKESALNSHMIKNEDAAIGKKALSSISTGDYVSVYNLLSEELWHREDERIIVIPMDIEDRLANLIRKGSLINVKVVLKDVKSTPKTVLSRITVEDVLDENGISLGDAIGSKKAFAKVILDKNQRDRFYIASQLGKLIFELYCDSTQGPEAEEFAIPVEYLRENSPQKQMVIPAGRGHQNCIPFHNSCWSRKV